MSDGSILQANKFRVRLDDWLNPIVVKELRQAVESRFVVSALLILLCIQLVSIGGYLIVWRIGLWEFDAGRQVFLSLYRILLGTSMLFVPMYSAIRLISERSETNVDLLFITTIKPRNIIAGKLIAAIVLTILIFSACTPFMVFTYFLRGIDLPSVFILFALAFLIVIGCAQMAILVACIQVSRVFWVLLGVMTLVFFITIYNAVRSSSSRLINEGLGSQYTDLHFWEAVTGTLSMFGFSLGLCFVLSVALITPLAANRALLARVFVTLAWVLLGGAAGFWSYLESDHRPVMFWQLLFDLIFALALFVAISERDRLGRRVLRSVPRSVVKRAVTFFFFSGSANGLTWASLGIIMTLVLTWVWIKIHANYNWRTDSIESAKWIGAMCLYFFCYALSGALLRRHLLKKISPKFSWLIGLILMGLGSVLPFLVGYLLFFPDQWLTSGYGRWLIGNPFAWGNRSSAALYLGVAAGWAALVLTLNLPWFIERLREFRPIKPPVV